MRVELELGGGDWQVMGCGIDVELKWELRVEW